MWSTAVGSPIDDESWHSLVATYDGSFRKIFIDGSKRHSVQVNGLMETGPYPLMIGRRGNNDKALLGSLDEARIYNRALSESEIRALYLLESAYQSYPLNGSAPAGATANGLEPAQDRKGEPRGAVRLSDANDQLVLSEFNATERWTLSSWLKPETLGNDPSSELSLSPGLNLEIRRGRLLASSAADLELLWVEPGTFTMGSPDTESGRDSNEAQRRVILSEGFYLGKHEVTQAQYQAVMQDNPLGLKPAPSHFQGFPNRPVETVTWPEAQAFCERLTQLERLAGRLPAGWSYALPTEAEWEYACREGGRKVRYCNGKAEADQSAIHFGYTYTAAGTRPVASFAPNALGLYDMSGNVWEWTCSEYKPHYDSSEERCGRAGSPCTLRGGSWGSGSRGVRASNRNVFYGAYGPDGGDGRRGFRLVRE